MEQQSPIHPQAAAAFAEQRSEHRRRVLKTGMLMFNKGYASYGCTVRNLTEAGAMVEMGETTGIPQTFDFRLDGKTTVPASIVWRSAKRIGLKFQS